MAWIVRKPILVPYDFSSHSRVAVDKALSMAESPAGIHVLHVLPTFIPLAPEGFPVEAIDDQVRLEYAQKSLDEEFADSRYTGIAKEVLIGDPGSVCADRAETIDADLIVLPSHGRSGVTRLLLGSVTERIVRLSKRPVLVLKIPQ
jgi:nucleotide-binding universal stress UspA family protein